MLGCPFKNKDSGQRIKVILASDPRRRDCKRLKLSGKRGLREVCSKCLCGLGARSGRLSLQSTRAHGGAPPGACHVAGSPVTAAALVRGFQPRRGGVWGEPEGDNNSGGAQGGGDPPQLVEAAGIPGDLCLPEDHYQDRGAEDAAELRPLLTTALPVALSSGGKSTVAEPMMVGTVKPRPKPITTQPGRMAPA